MIIDRELTVKELAKLNHMNYTKMVYYLINYNPMLAFQNDFTDNSIKNAIIRHYIQDISDIKTFCNKFYGKWTRSARNRFMLYLFEHKSIYYQEFERLLETLGTWGAAEELGTTQRSVRIIAKKLGIQIKIHNSSKIHLRMKPYIEKSLGYPTVSEYYIKCGSNKYFIDEFCEPLNLCVEIDGLWCHSVEDDSLRDSNLSTLGYRVLRIPTTVELSEIDNYIQSKLRDISSVG